ncbi:MAG: CsbD family protein [Actinomycetota bacterium]|nr:CsbD family protein [Actinomycetota bacterium]
MPDRGSQLEGKAKEVGGKLTGNEELESEGRTQKAAEDTKEKVQEGVDKVKGAVEGLRESAKH